MSKTDKPIWQLIELNYFRRLPPYRAWKRWLSVALGLGPFMWLGLAAVRNDNSPYSSGPMSVGHSQLADQCNQCHGDSWLGLRRLTTSDSADRTINEACIRCHGAAIDHDVATMAARHQISDSPSTDDQIVACASCHREHEGVTRLTEMPDDQCVRCHAELEETMPGTQYHKRITSFSSDHPEFRVLAKKQKDLTPIKLSHDTHLGQWITGCDRQPVQMTCSDCHRAGRSTAPWPYGRPALHEDAGLASTSSEPQLQGEFMNPIRYSLHCISCHELKVDQRLGLGGLIPHDSPQAIRTYLWGRLTQYIQANPDKLNAPSSAAGEMRRPYLTDLSRPEFNRRVLEWVETEVKTLERTLYVEKRPCMLCHEQTPAESGEPPVITPPGIPFRWYDHGSFNHEKHRVVECGECHGVALTSMQTTDVLLPGVGECRMCHAPRGATADGTVGGVAHQCVLCHTYHRAPSKSILEGARSIRDIVSEAPGIETTKVRNRSEQASRPSR